MHNLLSLQMPHCLFFCLWWPIHMKRRQKRKLRDIQIKNWKQKHNKTESWHLSMRFINMSRPSKYLYFLPYCESNIKMLWNYLERVCGRLRTESKWLCWIRKIFFCHKNEFNNIQREGWSTTEHLNVKHKTQQYVRPEM